MTEELYPNRVLRERFSDYYEEDDVTIAANSSKGWTFDCRKYHTKTCIVVADYALRFLIYVSNDYDPDTGSGHWFKYYDTYLTANEPAFVSFSEVFNYVYYYLYNPDSTDHTINSFTVCFQV